MASTQIPEISVPISANSQALKQQVDFRQATRALLVVGILALFVYRDVLWRLVQAWWEDPNYSHGFLMPLFAAFVIWRVREKLSSTILRPTWWGLPICIAAMGLLIVGDLGAEYFSSRFSLLVLAAGSILLFLGWNHLRMLGFAMGMLLLMIPIPTILLNEITFPLQLFASRLATALLSGVGVPVLRDGNVIQLPSTTLEVVTACSGIRSLVSLIALAAIVGYLKGHRVWHRWLLVGLAVPIAIVANSMRIMGTGLLAQYWDPEKAEGFFHLFEGWVIFVLSLGLLMAADSLILRLSHLRRQSA